LKEEQTLELRSRNRAQFELERKLAKSIWDASADVRLSLYNKVYDELYSKFPHLLKVNNSSTHLKQLSFLKQFLKSETTFVEIGPGDCQLAKTVARYVNRVFAIDVSKQNWTAECPSNFQFILFDGCDINLPPQTVDLVYTNHVIEHLHPEDAFSQIQSAFKALRT
jgi:SAM-dependent methyltransferase